MKVKELKKMLSIMGTNLRVYVEVVDGKNIKDCFLFKNWMTFIIDDFLDNCSLVESSVMTPVDISKSSITIWVKSLEV